MYGVLAPQPFEEAGSPSPPTSPTSTSNPYEQTLSRYRSSSFSTRSSLHGVASGTAGTAGGSPVASAETKEGGKKRWSLRRKNTGTTIDERGEREFPAALPGGMGGEVTPVGEESEPEVEIVPPAWKRRTSQIVREKNRGEGSSGIQARWVGVGEDGLGMGMDVGLRELSPPVPAFTKHPSGPPTSGSGNGEEMGSPGSSTSSLVPDQGTITPRPGLTPSRRSSMYTGIAIPATGSPLSKTTQEHEHHRHLRAASQVGGFEGMIPDMSNPTRPSGERPLDTVRRMSMISDGGTAGPGERGARRRVRTPAGGKRTITQGVSLVGIPVDDGIWPVMPLENGGPYGLAQGQREKNRSVISLTSLNPASLKSKSTPGSPIANGKRTISRSSSRSNLSAGTIGPVGSGLTMTAANRAQYVQTMQRDYSMRLGGTGREGGYAVAATMTGAGGLGRNGSSVGDFGALRYSGDWSAQQGAFYDQWTDSSSRPSLPFGSRSNSTSTTSLSLMASGQEQPLYPAVAQTQTQNAYPPSAFPPSLPTSMSSSPVLQKTPSPLSQTISASTGPTIDSSTLNPEEESKSSSGERIGLAPPLPVMDIPTNDARSSPKLFSAKNKKELAREAKEAKARSQREAKELALKRAETERKRKEQAKLDRERAKEQTRLAKKVKSGSLRPSPRGGQKESFGSTPVQALATNGNGNEAAVGTGSRRSSSIPTPPITSRSTSNNRISLRPMNKLVVPPEQDKPRVNTPAPTSGTASASVPAPTSAHVSTTATTGPTPSPLKKKQSFWETMRRKFSSGPEVVNRREHAGKAGSGAATGMGTENATGSGRAVGTPAPAPGGRDERVESEREGVQRMGNEENQLPSETHVNGQENGIDNETLRSEQRTENENENENETVIENGNEHQAEDAYANLRVQTPPPSVTQHGSSPEELGRITSAGSSRGGESRGHAHADAHGHGHGETSGLGSPRRRSDSGEREMEGVFEREEDVGLQARAI